MRDRRTIQNFQRRAQNLETKRSDLLGSTLKLETGTSDAPVCPKLRHKGSMQGLPKVPNIFPFGLPFGFDVSELRRIMFVPISRPTLFGYALAVARNVTTRSWIKASGCAALEALTLSEP